MPTQQIQNFQYNDLFFETHFSRQHQVQGQGVKADKTLGNSFYLEPQNEQDEAAVDSVSVHNFGTHQEEPKIESLSHKEGSNERLKVNLKQLAVARKPTPLIRRHKFIAKTRKFYFCEMCSAVLTSGPALGAHVTNKHKKERSDLDYITRKDRRAIMAAQIQPEDCSLSQKSLSD